MDQNKKDVTINDLAVMIGQGFSEVHSRLDNLEQGYSELKQGYLDLKQGQEEIKMRLTNVAYNFDLRFV